MKDLKEAALKAAIVANEALDLVQEENAAERIRIKKSIICQMIETFCKSEGLDICKEAENIQWTIQSMNDIRVIDPKENVCEWIE